MKDAHYCKWGEQCPMLNKWFRIMRSRVCVYDNGGRTADRYTVLIKRTTLGKKVLDVYGMSENPNSPQGFNQFSHTVANSFKDFAFTGVRVPPQDLPEEVKKAIEERLGN